VIYKSTNHKRLASILTAGGKFLHKTESAWATVLENLGPIGL